MYIAVIGKGSLTVTCGGWFYQSSISEIDFAHNLKNWFKTFPLLITRYSIKDKKQTMSYIPYMYFNFCVSSKK